MNILNIEKDLCIKKKLRNKKWENRFFTWNKQLNEFLWWYHRKGCKTYKTNKVIKTNYIKCTDVKIIVSRWLDKKITNFFIQGNFEKITPVIYAELFGNDELGENKSSPSYWH